MSNLNWRNFEEQKPEHGQHCLCKMKYGLDRDDEAEFRMMSGYYDADDKNFVGYYWWHAYEWVPIGEAM